MLRPLVLVAALAAVTPPAATAATQPVLHAFVPGTDLFVSVEHGPGEPHSVGSYAVRLYRVVHRDLPYDLYLSGLLRERSGAVQELILADLAGDNVPEIVVVTRAAGSGGYLFADSYAIRAFRLRSLAAVSWLPPDADPVASLRARLERTPDDLCGTARRATRTGSISGGSLCSSSAPASDWTVTGHVATARSTDPAHSIPMLHSRAPLATAVAGSYELRKVPLAALRKGF